MPVRILMAECRIHGTSNDRTNMRIAFSFFFWGGDFYLFDLKPIYCYCYTSHFPSLGCRHETLTLSSSSNS